MIAVTWRRFVVGVCLLAVWSVQAAQATNEIAQSSTLAQWLARVHQASNNQTYAGTFVISTESTLSSARIWHVCEGGVKQVERVEALSGQPRATYRRNGEVVTFFPASKRVVTQSRTSSGNFPDLGWAADASIGNYYQFLVRGSERIAGFDADVVELKPKDAMRYGLRIWTDKKSGLVLQIKTLDDGGRTLEQAAFSELKLDVPVDASQLLRAMAHTDGYQVEHAEVHKTSADVQGWAMRNEVPGFKSVGCYRRPTMLAKDAALPASSTLQWVFSDGLATVSVFVEPFGAQRRGPQGALALGGASNAMTKRIDAWWATAVGEVPLPTLGAFLQALERTR